MDQKPGYWTITSFSARGLWDFSRLLLRNLKSLYHILDPKGMVTCKANGSIFGEINHFDRYSLTRQNDVPSHCFESFRYFGSQTPIRCAAERQGYRQNRRTNKGAPIGRIAVLLAYFEYTTGSSVVSPRQN